MEKTLVQLHVFCVAKLVMVVLFDSKKFKKTIKLNESGQKEPYLLIFPFDFSNLEFTDVKLNIINADK